VTVAELLKRRLFQNPGPGFDGGVQQVHQCTTVSLEARQPPTVGEALPVISIVLSLDALDPQQPGYQLCLPQKHTGLSS
jgi:hypothetical protein